MNDGMRCQYQSANCENARSLKHNGELHGLCAFHRDKANKTQRRWHSRRRETPGYIPSPVTKSSSIERRAFARLSSVSVRAAAKMRRAEQRRRAQETLEARYPMLCRSPNDEEKTADDGGGVPMSDDDLHTLMMLVLEHDKRSWGQDEKAANDEDPEFAALLEVWDELTSKKYTRM